MFIQSFRGAVNIASRLNTANIWSITNLDTANGLSVSLGGGQTLNILAGGSALVEFVSDLSVTGVGYVSTGPIWWFVGANQSIELFETNARVPRNFLVSVDPRSESPAQLIGTDDQADIDSPIAIGQVLPKGISRGFSVRPLRPGQVAFGTLAWLPN